MRAGSASGPDSPGDIHRRSASQMIASSPRLPDILKTAGMSSTSLVIVFALIPATGQFAMIARLARLLRVLRLISAIRDLRLIVAALVRSIPAWDTS